MKKKNNNQIKIGFLRKYKIINVLELLLGLTLFSVAFNFFLLPNDLVFGGVSGLSIIFNHLFGIDPSIFVLIVSIGLLFVSLIFLGKEKTAGSVLGSLLLPLFLKITELFTVYFSFDTTDIFLAAIFGGVLSGVGIGLVYKAGFTTGGTDIINQILNKYLKISLGKCMLFSDGFIVGCSIFVFGIVKFMYAVVVLSILSVLTDRVLLGISKSKAFYIVTDKVSEVKNFVLLTMGHGVTVFDAIGGFSKEDQKVLFCVVPTREYFRLKEGIHEIDNDAFFVVTDAYEVFGGE